MSTIRLAGRYAKSLIDLALERQVLEKVFEDIKIIHKAVNENRDFHLLLKSPIIHQDRKRTIVHAVFEGKISDLTMKFLDIIISKKREEYIADVTKDFIRQYNSHKNITTVKLTTAVPVGDDLKQRIIKLLKENYNKEKIELKSVINEKLIGGFTLEFDNQLLDASIAHKFESLKQEFSVNPYLKKV